MTSPTFTKTDIQKLVDDFYGQIRVDPVLGPIFNQHIQDWPAHLEIMVRFWSSLLLRTADFNGSPMMKHAAIPDLSAELFEHWLGLFKTTCEQQPPELGARAWEFSQRIARSLWMGYQIQQRPNQAPNELQIPVVTQPE